MKFSIVIPTYNNLEELRRCLGALDKMEGVPFEVFVGVDGSTDGTADWLETAEFSYPMTALYHPKRENQGRAATRNLALPHLRGTYSLFLDSDMEVQPDLFERHLEVLEKGNTVSIGLVWYRNIGDNVWVRYISQRGVGKYEHGKSVPFHYFITPNTALPTEWLLGVDGFDPKINRYGGEDMELGYRVHRKYKPQFILNAEAKVYTTQPKTLDEALSQLYEYGSTGLPYIVKKWPELDSIFLVHKCHSRKLTDRLFEWSTKQPFRSIGRFFARLLPFFLAKHFINYLVISYIHQGYRESLGK